MATIASLVVSVSANTAKFQRDMQGAGKSVGQFRQSTNTASRGLSLLKGAFAAFAAGAVLRTVIREFNEMRQAMDATMKSARLLGVSFAQLKQYQLFADLTGLGKENIAPALSTFAKRLGEAARGGGAAAPALRELGLEAKDLVDLPLPEALERVSAEFVHVDSDARRAAIAANLFSKANVKMALVLAEGRDKLRELREEARRGITDEQVADVEFMNDTFAKAGFTWESFKERVTAANAAMFKWNLELWKGKDAVDAAVASSKAHKDALAAEAAAMEAAAAAELKRTETLAGLQKAARERGQTMRESLQRQLELIGGADPLDLQLRDALIQARPVLPLHEFVRYRSELEALVEQLKQARKSQEAWNERLAEAKRVGEEAYRADKQRREEMARRGQALTESLYTPGERFLKEVADIERLMKAGAISTGVGFLAQQRAAGKYLDRQPRLIGSATRGSGAAYEAIVKAQQRGDPTQNKIRVAIEKAVEEAVKQSKLLASIEEKTQAAKVVKAPP